MLVPRSSSATNRHVYRFAQGHWNVRLDALATEEPLELRLRWQSEGVAIDKSIAITMRTPGEGQDFELAAGYLFAEGIIHHRDDILDLSYLSEGSDTEACNTVTVTLRPGVTFSQAPLERNFVTTSACGVCGKASLEALNLKGYDPLPSGFSVSADLLCGLPEALRAAQSVFDRTGGLHAAGLFAADGTLIDLREDVGRHNAVDKLIGSRVLRGATPLDGTILMLSGRASFELVQKALVARIPVVAAVGAPSTLAAELAESFNLTLAGFVRPTGFNAYAAPERITVDGDEPARIPELQIIGQPRL